MKIIAIVYGLLITALTAVYFNVSDGGIVLLGLSVLVIVLALLQGQWEHKNALFGTVLIAILMIVGWLLGMLFRSIGWGEATTADAFFWRSMMAGASLGYVVLAVFLIPNFWEGWKTFGRFLGDWTGRAVLVIFYFTVMVPFGLGVRLFGDPLEIKKPHTPFWRPRTTGDQTMDDVLRQSRL